MLVKREREREKYSSIKVLFFPKLKSCKIVACRSLLCWFVVTVLPNINDVIDGNGVAYSIDWYHATEIGKLKDDFKQK